MINNDKTNTPSTTAYTAAASAAAIATSDNDYNSTRQKRNKFLSLFPSSSKDEGNQNNMKWISSSCSQNNNNDNNNNNNNKAQTIQCPPSTSFYGSPTTTSSTLTTSSSSSTVCPSPIPTTFKPHFKVVNPSCKPDYANLRKHFSKFQSKSKHRSDIIKSQLLPWLRKYVINLRIETDFKEESGLWGLKTVSKEKKELQFGRSVLLRWWRSLLSAMLLTENDERCLYFESILEIVTRCEFLDFDYVGPDDYTQWCKPDSTSHLTLIDEYRQLLNATLKYALDRLNQKAVYSNMISFCAKILALFYFKIPGLASSLLQALSIRPAIMRRLCSEMTDVPPQHKTHSKQILKLVFPSYLHQLLSSNAISYQNHFASIKIQKTRLPINLDGNWIRRWQSDDSELFFSFYRHYHSTLKSYISAVYPNINRHQLYQRNSILMSCPGYMYFATFFAGKVDSLINREIHSVTTTMDQQPVLNNNKKISFSSSTVAPVDNISMINETRPFMSASGCNDYTAVKAHHNIPTGKPKPLEMATKRYAECMTWCIVAADPSGLYHDMINVWIRFAIKRTTLTEAEGVYCLLDFIEQTILELQKFPLQRNYFPIDLPFILHALDIILSRSDHTISLLRALSFIYVHFGFLTSHAALLDLLCNRIMLDTQTFERLLLHWGKNVRVFFIRCLMWRVGRVWHHSGIRWNSEAEQMVKMMVRGNNDAAMCDGHSCWSQWMDRSKETPFPNFSAEIKAYQQCSLEVHIVLEALMVSFHRNHSYFQHSFTGLPSRERLDFVISATSSCASPIPDRIKCFSSQLAIPASDSNYLSPSYGRNDTMDSTSRYNNYKRVRSTPNLKKRHMMTRSRTGKGRLLRLFNSSYPILCDDEMIDDGAYFSGTKNDVMDKFMLSESNTLATNEFYTVNSTYTASSLLLSESQDDIPSSSSSSPNTIPKKYQEGEVGHCQENAVGSAEDCLQVGDHHLQIPSPVSLVLQKDLYDISVNEKEHEDADMAYSEALPAILGSARSWKYPPSSHVYASKILSEMKVIMHEYCIWLDKTQESRSKSSMIFVPRLSLDWPKNWTFSHN